MVHSGFLLWPNVIRVINVRMLIMHVLNVKFTSAKCTFVVPTKHCLVINMTDVCHTMSLSLTATFYMCVGIPYGRDLDYLLGFPFYNETLGNITGIVPEQTDWTYVDRNVSDFMQQMWLNFTKYG